MSGCRELPLAIWVLARCTSDYRRDSLIGDLLEQYEERGGWWYCRQVLGAVRTHPFRLLCALPRTYVPSVEDIGDLIMCIVLGFFGLPWLAMCAALLIGRTPLVHSGPSLIAGGVMIGAALIVGAAAVHGMRTRSYPNRLRQKGTGTVPVFGTALSSR